jgi:hypothetical protein
MRSGFTSRREGINLAGSPMSRFWDVGYNKNAGCPMSRFWDVGFNKNAGSPINQAPRRGDTNLAPGETRGPAHPPNRAVL